MPRTTQQCPIPIDDLKHQYLNEKRSVMQLAEDLRASEYYVRKWLKQADVKIRGRAEANQISGPARAAR